MIEYAERELYFSFRDPDWRPVPPQAITDGNIQFGNYVYRIEGCRTYIIQNKEFDVEFERIMIWALMGRL